MLFALEREAPADGLAPGIASLDLVDECTGLIYGPVWLMSIELHSFLVRKRHIEVLCISWLDLPEEQPVRRERWKAGKCGIDGHTRAPLLRLVIHFILKNASQSKYSCREFRKRRVELIILLLIVVICLDEWSWLFGPLIVMPYLRSGALLCPVSDV